MTKTVKKSVAFLSAAVMFMAMLLYFPGGTFSNIDWGLKASAATTITESKPATGDGSESNPYQIGTAAELYWFAGLVNGTLDGVTQNTAAWAKLTANITVNNNVLVDGALNTTNSGSFTSWTPIGNYDNQYTGTFNGNGKTISGLYFDNGNTNYVGLFGYVGSGGNVSNVGIVDSYFNGKRSVGGVCGENYGTIKNCYNTGAVSGSSYVGGVCGRNEGVTITNCYSTGAVSGTVEYIGGVCGRNGSTIKNCYSTGAVSGNANVGGVCGYNSRTIENCYSTGTVSAAGDYVGGVCGRNYATIKNCYSTGAVSGTSVWVGGVCGDNEGGTITNCYNIGAVSGASGYVGGVCGYNVGGTIKNCYYDTDFYTGNAIGKSTGGETNVPGKTTADLCGSLDDLGFDSTVWTAGSYSAVGKKATATFPQPKVFENTSAPKTTLSLYNFGTNGSTDWKPYTEISTAEELQNIKNNLSGNYVLTTDITLTAPATESDSNWTPIGSGAGFTGKFSGDGHTISGIVIKTTSNYQGLLFGYSTGTIMNVGVIDSSISGKEFVGGVCGQNDGTIKNCYSTGTVSGSWYVGGVCGRNKGTITNCYSTGEVSGSSYVGGVCGRNEGTITNCYSTGEVSGSSYVGGVCGMNYYSTITNCYYDTDFYTGNAIGSVSGTVTNVTGKTTAALCGSTLPTGFDSAVWNVGSAGSVTATVGNYGKKTYTSPSLKGVGSAFTLEVNVYNFGTNGSDDWDTYTKISTAEALQNINNNLSGNYVLTADITLTAPAQGGSNWTAIGTYLNPFTGKFDGNGHTISGIVINKSDENDQGLFGYSTGLIMNVGVLDSSISGGNSVGGVCGWNEGTITNCYSTGAVSGTGVDVGGVCGYNYCGTIKNCYSTGAVSGSSYVGGVCGYNYCGTIKNCYSTGTVSGENVVGGVCGQNNSDGTIKNCYYLTGTATNAIGYNGGTSEKVESKTDTQFGSGEVAYLLSKGCTTNTNTYSGDVWGQAIGTDAYPVLGGAKVYQNLTYAGCEGKPGEPVKTEYSNTQLDPVYADHTDGDEDGKCDTCSKYMDNIGARLVGHSLTLDGSVGVNFYMELSSEVISDSNAYMEFTLPGGKTSTVKVSEAPTEVISGTTYYKFKCQVNATAMTDTITAQIKSTVGNSKVYEYTVKEYADYLFEHKNENTEFAKAAELIEAMVNYGSYAQIYAGYNAEKLAVGDAKNLKSLDDVWISEYYEPSIYETKVQFAGANLSLLSTTTLRMYFQLIDVEANEVRFGYQGQLLEMKQSGDYYYVELVGIPASKLDDEFRIDVLEGSTNFVVTYTPMAYCTSVVTRPTTETRTESLKNLIKALVMYNQAADAYISEN